MSEQLAFRMKIYPGQAAEYEKRHDEIWPDLSAALKEAGVSDYSIWLDPETDYLFATLTLTDDNTMADMPDSEIVKRWWSFMADIMDTHPDNVPVQVELKRVFHLA
jgi:L-rhamnose mutarotase